MSDTLSAPVQRAIEELIGRASFRDINGAAATNAGLWKVQDGNSNRYFLKVFDSEESFRRELAAYRDWLPRGHLPTPQFAGATNPDIRGLLLSWIDGQDFPKESLTLSEDLAVFEQAGAFLSELHRLSVRKPDINVIERTREKGIERCKELRGHLPDDVVTWIRRKLEAEGWGDLQTAFCHGDYSPRNWILTRDGSIRSLAVIDFEHSQVGLAIRDTFKLWDESFIHRPDRRTVFYSGYGRAPEEDIPSLRLLAPIHGLAIMTWSLARRDAHYFEHGRQFLLSSAQDETWFVK